MDRRSQFLQEYRSLDATSIRLGIDWAITQPSQSTPITNLGVYEQILPQFSQDGIEIIGLFNTAPAWINLGNPSPASLNAMTAAVKATAVRAYQIGCVRRWEFWNEPGLRGDDVMGVPAIFRKWLDAFLAGIAQAEDELHVDLEASTGTPFGMLNEPVEFIEEVFGHGLECPRGLDAISVHPYFKPKSLIEADSQQGINRTGINSCQIQAVRDLAYNVCGIEDIWLTEYGWNLMEEFTEADQASYLQAAHDWIECSPYIQVANLHMLHDFNDSRGHEEYGLINDAFITGQGAITRRASYSTFQQLRFPDECPAQDDLMACATALQPSYPGCNCDPSCSADNYCNYAPNTPSCPMTSGSGYCVSPPANWPRGFMEYEQNCRRPGRPEILQPAQGEEVASSPITLSWSPVSDGAGRAITYTVRVRDSQGETVFETTVSSTEAQFTNPHPGEEYTWEVSASNPCNFISRYGFGHFRAAEGSSRLSLDIAFVIDATGSMWDDIARVQEQSEAIVQNIASLTSDFRVAVATYKDYPSYPYGDSTDYPYRAHLAFSGSSAAIINAVHSISVGGGGNVPESVYTGLYRTIRAEGLGPWRSTAHKVIILLGDAPPNNPEPYSGLTLDQVIAAAGSPVEVLSSNVSSSRPVKIYSILVGNNSSAAFYFDRLSQGTGGTLFRAATAQDVVAAILAAIGNLPQPPPSGNRAPLCNAAVADNPTLWPPNHKTMAELRVLGVTDPDGDPVGITITGITQDEPVKGPKAGSFAPDATGVGTNLARVRMERTGGGGGRVYRISFQASDGRGGQCTGTVFSCVPHDQGENVACADEGETYDSTAP